ncbi:MAG: copper resistance protein CopC [Pseudohongiellaceae bacterium]
MTRKAGIVMLVALLLGACASPAQRTPLLGAEPEVSGIVTNAPRTLRLYFEALPDVPRSNVELEGPDGEMLTLRGIHTMGADDLMMEINDNVPNGEYTVRWNAYIGDDPTGYEGSYNFTVDAAD